MPFCALIERDQSPMTPKAASKKSAKKKTSRPAKKKVAKRPAGKKTGRARKKRRPKKARSLPMGYAATPDGLLVPASIGDELSPVPPEKIRFGLTKAKTEIQKLMEELAELTDGYTVSEIELAASFSADGKFLGIGVGGATTIKVRFKPEEDGDGG